MADIQNGHHSNRSHSHLGLVMAAIAFLACAILFGEAAISAMFGSQGHAAGSSLYLD